MKKKLNLTCYLHRLADEEDEADWLLPPDPGTRQIVACVIGQVDPKGSLHLLYDIYLFEMIS